MYTLRTVVLNLCENVLRKTTSGSGPGICVRFAERACTSFFFVVVLLRSASED